MAKFSCWIMGMVFFFLSGVLQAQQESIPEDSAGFRDFLISQDEIPGVGYRYHVTAESLPETIASDSILMFARFSTGFKSRMFTDFDLSKELDSRLHNDSLDFRQEYLLFSDTASFEAVRAYVLNQISTGAYLVKKQDESDGGDLVALAIQSHYSPVTKFKLKFSTDYRLFFVTLIIVVFFLVAFSMTIAMVIMKAGKIQREQLQEEYGTIIIDPLTSLLFEKELDEIKNLDLSEINAFWPDNLRKKPLFQRVLIESIISLNKKMKGEFKEKLKALYKKLELDKLSMRMLHHKKWDRVTMALVHINEMDLVEALPEVKKFVNSKNFHIRSMAVSTLLNLSEKVDLKFLRDQTYPLSLWQQMNYLRIIRFVSQTKDLKLEILFDSQNASIRIFGVKLVRILGRIDLIEKLSVYAQTATDEEKAEVLDTYAAVGAYMEASFINSCLTSCDPRLSQAAARAAAVTGDEDSAEILATLAVAEPVFRRKLNYLKALYTLDQEKFASLMAQNDRGEMAQIREHILDPMLQHV